MGMVWCNHETQSPLEVPKDMLRMGVAWSDQIFQILGVTGQLQVLSLLGRRVVPKGIL